MNCPQCGSPDLIPDVKVIDRGHAYTRHDLTAAVDADPSALFFTGRVESELRARICGSCGHATLYATNATELWRAYQQARSTQS